ncbi:MAG: PIN domain-containing protein [Dysgonamonadaceae bacterium]|jgi:predicted nucleic acid-binding protein|nr:PIN domain-containing protein [Dysgonamonadaceae bacterium]
MIEKQFALDTNILIYLEGNDPAKRKIAESLLSLDPVIPSQVIFEFINVTRRLRNIPKRQLIKEAADLFRHCSIAPVYHSTLVLAENLVQKYDFQLFDSFIVASAFEAGCDILYSEDIQHNMTVREQIRIINPFY